MFVWDFLGLHRVSAGLYRGYIPYDVFIASGFSALGSGFGLKAFVGIKQPSLWHFARRAQMQNKK